MIWLSLAISSNAMCTASSWAGFKPPSSISFSVCSRTSESGVFSSCEASAVKRRVWLNATSSRSNISLSNRAKLEISSCTAGTGMRSPRLSELMRAAVSWIKRTG